MKSHDMTISQHSIDKIIPEYLKFVLIPGPIITIYSYSVTFNALILVVVNY